MSLSCSVENLELFLNKCKYGKYQAVEMYLNEGMSPNIQNNEGESPLQIAAANGYFKIVELLLKNGATVDLQNNYGWTPLMLAAKNGYSKVVSLLIQKKAKVNISNRLGLRPLDLAAWNGDYTCLKLLIEYGAVIDNMPSSGQNNISDLSSLMAAALQGHNYILNILLEKGSPVNQASPVTGLTPLMLAACNGNILALQALIQWGGDVNKTDICGNTALEHAVACGKRDVIGYLEESTMKKTSNCNDSNIHSTNILQALRSGDIIKVKALLKHNPSLCNYVDADGVTPLMLASMFGCNNIVDLLISNGGDMNAQDLTNGWTPLMYAVFHRQAETVHLLIDKGVNVEILTSNGYTAFDLATHIDSSETDIVETLMACCLSDEWLETQDITTSPRTSATKRNLSTNEKSTSRNDSPARIKDWIGGISSHFRQISKSSSSTNVPNYDEMYSDVFLEENFDKTSDANFICTSKFYAPDERFAHIWKEQKVEPLTLPVIPETNYDEVLKAVPIWKESVNRKKSKKFFNSLQTPNLLKHYNPNNLSRSLEKLHEKKLLDLSRLNKEDTCTAISDKNVEEIPANSKNFINIKKGEDFEDNIPESLTELLDKESLKKYAEKFRYQEIDLDTFQHLTEDDLHEIGINSLESRHKFLEIIEKLKQH